MLDVSPALVGSGSAVGSALLALWLCVRVDLGPQTMRGAFGLCVAAECLLLLVDPAMGRIGVPAVGLLVVAIPAFTFAFWSAAVLLRLYTAGPPRPARDRVRRD